MLELVQEEHSQEHLGRWLQDAWFMRWNQNIDESLLMFARAQSFAKWEILSVDNITSMADKAAQELYLEALLLKGSFLRFQGQEQKSSALLRKILLKIEKLPLRNHFRFHFEMGMDAWRREDPSGAMDNFLLAHEVVRNIYEEAFCLMNILLCLEALDLKRKVIEEKLQRVLLEIENSFDPGLVKNVSEQWKTYEMRKRFFQKMELTFSPDATGQRSFLQTWISELPYMAEIEGRGYEFPSSFLWQGSYRMRTLVGIWAPSDRTVVRVADGIDRLYLWVWKWMANDHISREQVLWTLESVLDQLEFETQSKENLLLLRNSVFWLINLSPDLEVKLKKLLLKLEKISSENYQTLEAEYLLIQCLFQNGEKKLIELIEKFPAFKAILSKTHCYPRLEKRLEVLSSAHQGNSYAIVDLVAGKVEVPFYHRSIRSPSMARLIYLLDHKQLVSYTEIENDPTPRKIYNLVERLKNIFPEKSLSIENGCVKRGKHWPEIKWASSQNEEAPASETLATDFTASKLKFVGSYSHLMAARALMKEGFNRKELEASMQVSKATACRMIEKWIEEKWIIKHGDGKAVFYAWAIKGNRI